MVFRRMTGDMAQRKDGDGEDARFRKRARTRWMRNVIKKCGTILHWPEFGFGKMVKLHVSLHSMYKQGTRLSAGIRQYGTE